MTVYALYGSKSENELSQELKLAGISVPVTTAWGDGAIGLDQFEAGMIDKAVEAVVAGRIVHFVKCNHSYKYIHIYCP